MEPEVSWATTALIFLYLESVTLSLPQVSNITSSDEQHGIRIRGLGESSLRDTEDTVMDVEHTLHVDMKTRRILRMKKRILKRKKQDKESRPNISSNGLQTTDEAVQFMLAMYQNQSGRSQNFDTVRTFLHGNYSKLLIKDI